MKKPAKDYLIFPLDVSSPEAARHYIDLLSDHVGMFKIGLELFVRSGPEGRRRGEHRLPGLGQCRAHCRQRDFPG